MVRARQKSFPIIRTGLLSALSGLVFICASALPGCRNKDDQPTVPITKIKSIDFSGNKAFSDGEIREYLTSRKRGPYIDARALADREIIVELYRSAGYYDTEVSDPKVTVERRDRVSLSYKIIEGEPVRVVDVNVIITGALKPALNTEKLIKLKTGDRADINLLNSSRDRLIEELRQRGHALAVVTESMEVSEQKKQAVVTFVAEPGPICRVGDIGIEGLKLIPEPVIAKEVADFEGEKYTPDLQEELERQLSSLGVFSLISLTQADKLNSQGRLPLTLQLGEADFQSFKFGFGLGFEPNRQIVRGSAYYTHNNLGGHLNRLSLTLQGGYAFVPAVWDIQQHGPVVLVEPSISRRGFHSSNTWWTITPSFETNVEEDYKYLTPKITPSVSRILKRRFFLRLAYNFQYFFMYGVQSEWATAIANANANLETPFRLATIESSIRIKLTDNLIDPKNGVSMKLTWWFSGLYVGSQADFNKINPSISGYWQMSRWLQLALRTEIGMIFPYGETTDAGIWTNFFLGGFNTVRGWGGKRLSPREDICIAPDDCEELLTGGATMVLGNAELRFRLGDSFYILPFLDVGDVQFEAVTFKPERWNYSAGLGLRYDSPVGKIRLDFGVRLNNPEPYKDEDRVALHIGIGEAF